MVCLLKGENCQNRYYEIAVFIAEVRLCRMKFNKESMNQRTNGPVNADLISGPTISTKTSFNKFYPCPKIGQGQLRVIININFEELEYILLHAKFHDHRTPGSVGEDFLKVFTIYGHGGHLGHVTWTILYKHSFSPLLQVFPLNDLVTVFPPFKHIGTNFTLL